MYNSDELDQNGFTQKCFHIELIDQNGYNIDGFNRKKELTEKKERVEQAICKIL